jgi:glycerol kinase
MKKYILSLDQGTSSSRSVLFNLNREIIGIEQAEFNQYYPQPGYVEHNPHEIWETQYLTAKTLLTKYKIKPSEIAAFGITNQRETTVLWDKITGEPVYNAIVWQDKRTIDTCNFLKESGCENEIKEKTGLVVDSYFSATKISWILDHVEGVRRRAEAGEILFGTVDTWLIWKLSGGKLHITDFSNASRTMLFNIGTLKWDTKLLEILNIPNLILPEVRNSSELYGYTSPELFENVPIPLAGIAGDQQAALFGQHCFKPGSAKNTYGTGCFMLMNTGSRRIRSESGLLTTIAWSLNNKITYALEGSVFIAGAAVKWLRDGLKIIKSASETEAMALEAGSSEGVYFVPAFAGLGAPYWDSKARGTLVGLTQGITEKHIVRAALEAMAYQTKDVIDAMSADSGINPLNLNADGGASVNNFLLQFQSDILNISTLRPRITESTALGAAYLAGLAVDFWKSDNLVENREIDREFTPKMDEKQRKNLYAGWQNAVKQARGNFD